MSEVLFVFFLAVLGLTGGSVPSALTHGESVILNLLCQPRPQSFAPRDGDPFRQAPSLLSHKLSKAK